MATTGGYDKDFAIKQMTEILDARLKLADLDFYNVVDLAKHLGVSSNTLYTLWNSKMNMKWTEMVPIEVLVRKPRGDYPMKKVDTV